MTDKTNERFTGHGAEWRDSNLSTTEAKIATSWVELKVDKRSMLTQKDRVEDVRDAMWDLEKDGEIVVHRVSDEHQPVMVKTLYGWDKKIPTTRLWHHKSCGQCGNIPGYPASLLWLMNRMDIEYLDETDQTSCTAWNYHGSGIGNLESLAAVFLRNFHQAYVAAKAQGLPESYYYPLVHCGTSFGNYKEVRSYLIHSAKLRERVRAILGKLGRLVDGKLLIPEEVVHYSEWLHVMRERIAGMREIDCSQVRATIHPACHVYKMVPADAIYDDNINGGNRLAVSTGVMQALGAQVIDYSTWYDCCGFGFRHIISEREFTRSFAIDRKIRVAVEEARADVMIGHDTGCITTLDKNQWISKSGPKPVELAVLADCQFAALACGAHPYKIVQSHWHASPTETLMEKMGIDWEAKKAEFVAYLEEIKTGKPENLYDPRRMITSGPGYIPLKAVS
ncbi:MAG: heterodisulfide reductase-related iron-sulfur binding cluster [Proteobacteria bacterium]|nr:heterodisulfide reductase-related iron-sulfur binding cluster [Pseudomonadota bacterium]